MTTTYDRQTDGLTERLSKTFADMLAMYVSAEHRTCDAVRPNVVFAYTTAVQESTQMIEFRPVHGREATTTLDATLPNVTHGNDHDVAAYLKLAEARRFVQLQIKE